MRGSNSPGVERYVGMSSADAYTQILLMHRHVQRAAVFRYHSPPPLQRRIQLTSDEQSLVDRAISLRKSTHLPFWHALFATFLQGESHTDQLIEAAFYHNGPGEVVGYDRNEVEAGALIELAQRGEKNLGLSSWVSDADGRVWHLPLLDFHCEISPSNELLAARVCSRLMPEGYLLIDSGDSYHACGLELHTPEQRVHMLGMALLAMPAVDGHYIAHQLLQDVSSIRISKGGKASREPCVVRAWVPN